MRNFISKRNFFTSAVSVFLSVFMVAVVAYGASTMDTASVGAGTSTPGASLGVKGAALIEGQIWADNLIATSSAISSGFGTTAPGAEFTVSGSGIFEGFVSSNYFTSTSTNTSWVMGQVGIGTTTPGAQLAVDGMGLFNGIVEADSFVATSTSATSTLKWSLDVATSSLQVSGVSGQVVIGATTTIADGGVMGRDLNPDPALTITGTGNAASATGTLYVSGGGINGGEIIIRSSDGFNCVSLTVLSGNVDPFTSNIALATLLNAKIVACPR